jgi:hypothetical protein
LEGHLIDKWEIDVSRIDPWIETLDYMSQVRLVSALSILATEGPHCGRPLVDRVRYSTFSNMKELRVLSTGHSALRVLFAFDPLRVAIMLVGGDKKGRWSKWYRENIPVADALFAEHLKRLEGRRR